MVLFESETNEVGGWLPIIPSDEILKENNDFHVSNLNEVGFTLDQPTFEIYRKFLKT